MARDVSDATPIGARAELVEWISSGEKPRDEWRLGTEHEKVPFYRADLSPVPYDGERGIRALLEGLQGSNGWDPILEDGRPIGLFDEHGGAAISLEPGGQFELSGAPVETLHETDRETAEHLLQVKAVGDRLGVAFLTLGMSPAWTRVQTPHMPKSATRIMTAYMPKVGTLRPRHDVPHRHRAGESRLRRRGRHGEEAARVAGAAADRHGAVRELALYRRQAQRLSELSLAHLARHRQCPRRACCPSPSRTAWASSAMSTMRSTCRCTSSSATTNIIDVAGDSLPGLHGGKLPQLPGEKPTIKDWDDHLSTLFPEVRLKRFLEMRGADGGPAAHRGAARALGRASL